MVQKIINLRKKFNDKYKVNNLQKHRSLKYVNDYNESNGIEKMNKTQIKYRNWEK
jgi:hypothetical protein